MKKYGLVVVLFLFATIQLFSQIKVVPVTDKELQIKENAVVYFLPQKLINVRVDVETRYFIAGSFCKYAEKYLLLDDVSSNNYTYSEIVNIDFDESIVPDPKAGFFVLEGNTNIQFDEKGIIIAYNDVTISKNRYEEYSFSNIPEYFNNGEIIFTDYSVKRNFTGVTDTTYKVIQLDSVFQKIPVYNTVITSKDYEQKAEEAANFIIKLRKNRFRLQTGQFETEKPPKDIKFLIEELDRLEKQYLELFIGKEIIVKNSFYATFKPKNSQKEDKVVLFYLSDELGICDKSNADTEPVYLKYKNCGVMSELDNFYVRQIEFKEKEKSKGLYYRIPGRGLFTLVYDGHEFAKQSFIIPQYGYLNNLPAKMFKNKKLKIIFDQETGSILRICNE
jgi:hypothetical protein